MRLSTMAGEPHGNGRAEAAASLFTDISNHTAALRQVLRVALPLRLVPLVLPGDFSTSTSRRRIVSLMVSVRLDASSCEWRERSAR